MAGIAGQYVLRHSIGRAVWKPNLLSNPNSFWGTSAGMNRQEILDRLRENERALRERGVTHAALFGSRARGDNGPNSDTDIMIDVDPEVEMSVYDYVGLKRYIAGLLDGRVDVVNRDALKPHNGPAATADAVYAF
jgi:predicted nucleotidyltransferase